VHDAKPGVETFRVAHEDDLGLNEDVSVRPLDIELIALHCTLHY
jgi:hypothetical protein